MVGMILLYEYLVDSFIVDLLDLLANAVFHKVKDDSRFSQKGLNNFVDDNEVLWLGLNFENDQDLKT